MNVAALRTACAAVCMMAATAALASEVRTRWTYEGEEGPERWGDLAAEYASCATGQMQSPVDLAEAEAAGSIAYTVEYDAVPLTIVNNGHTVQFNVENGGRLSANGVDYPLVQVHFHAPSEHVVKGEHYPLEAHFVHRSADGVLAVLGVFIEEGAENPALAAMIRHLPRGASEPETFAGTAIDPNALLPADRSIYRYMGSLTTPPCSEGVSWHVLSHAVTATKEQIEELSGALRMNARPVQPLNSRLLIAPSE